MKEVKDCPICFERKTDVLGGGKCGRHGFPYRLLAEWSNERLRDVEEYYQDQIPVLQLVLSHLTDFVARVEECGEMNEALAETIAFLVNVEKLSSGQLRTLELLTNGHELTKSGNEWCFKDSDEVIIFSPWKEYEIRPLQEIGYLNGTCITASGQEAFRIYKTAHPLLFD